MIQKKINKDGLRKKALILGSVLVVLFLAYGFYSSFYEETDDAFLDGHIVAVSARVPGHVQNVLVTDNQIVEKGAVLVELDSHDYEVKVSEAKAELLAAQAEQKRAKGDFDRYQKLIGRDEISQQAYAHADAEAQKAQAGLESSQARLKRAELDLSYTKIVAPWAGRVTRKAVEVGASIQTGQPLFALVSPELWVVANFKESQIHRMRSGQPVRITIDALDKDFRGHVDSIQAGSGARFSLFPPENATGNFVKIVQRVPVKIIFDEVLPEALVLGPGLSVVPQVRVK